MSSAVKRTFTIQGSDLGFEGGKYTGVSPFNAARKAAKQLFHKVENKAKNPKWSKYAHLKTHKVIKFILRETTQGSGKNTFFYEGSVEHLAVPKVITRNGVEITITKKVTIKTCEDHMVGTYKRKTL